MNRDSSKSSLMKRDGSMNKLVEEKQLGPQKMIKKVNQQVGYNQWNQGPNLQRPPSNMKNGSQQKRQENDYEEPLNEPIEDDGLDEVDRIRAAMASEKMKAQQYSEQQIVRKVEPKATNKLSQLGQQKTTGNPMNLNKNLDGFAKQKGLVIGARVDHRAADTQKRRAQELKDLIQLSEEEHFNVFEMVPKSKQDLYFDKLQSNAIKTAIVSTADDCIEQDIQTDDLGQQHKFN